MLLSPTELLAEIEAQLPTNSHGAITAAKLRALAKDIVNNVDNSFGGLSIVSGADIQVAIDSAEAAGGGTVYVVNHGAPYTISAPIRIATNVDLKGLGTPVIKLANSANCDIIQSKNDVYGLIASGAFSDFNNFSISGLILDGNSDNQTPANADQCNGIAVYAYGYDLDSLVIRNVKGHGIRSAAYQFSPALAGTDVGRFQSHFTRIDVINSGRHGVWISGPSDTYWASVHAVDASQEADDIYDGFHITGRGGLRGVDLHGWHRAEAINRVRYQIYVGDDSAGTSVVDSHFEGGRQQVYLGTGGFNSVIGGLIYAPFSLNAQIVVAGPFTTVDTDYTSWASFPDPIVVQIGVSGVLVYGYHIRINAKLASGAVNASPVQFTGTSDFGGTVEIYTINSAAANLQTGTRAADTRGFVRQGFPSAKGGNFGPMDNLTQRVYKIATSANTTFVVPATYAIRSIYFANYGAGAVTGGFKIGTTSGASDVVAAQAVGATSFGHVADAAILKRLFGDFADGTLFLQAVTSWGTSSVTFVIELAKVF